LSQVNWVKWACLFLQAICLLIAIALMHNDNRVGSALAMGLFATGVAVSILLIASHNRPFTGEISVGPGPLLQALPDIKTSAK
jgi:multisubunit Na+/H+ antiporter MnhC subunit